MLEKSRQRFSLQLPIWAQPVHPVLRYLLQRQRPQDEGRLRRILRLLLPVLAGLVLLLLGYQIATNSGTQPALLHDILYWPLVLFGIIVGLTAITLPGNVVSAEKARGTWDTLRVTSRGASLTLQARWVAVFYNLRTPLVILFLARVALIAGILVDLAQYFRGQWLDLLLSGITPEVPVFFGAALLAATMAVGLLQPLVAVGLDAAVGLLVGVVIRQPRYAIMVQAALGGLRVLLAVAALVVGTQAMQMPPQSEVGSWLGITFLSVFGDQGLRLLNLQQYSALWPDLPYSVFIGALLLFLTLGQAWLANRIVGLAVYLSERVE